MKTINLINLEKSDIKYERTVFPDGEPHIKLDPIDRKDIYNVITRISNPDELFLTLQVGDILKRQGVIFDLTITYLMSMRMDRVVNFEESFTLNLVAQMINSLEARKVYIFEAHSDRTFDLIKNSEKLDEPSERGYSECHIDATGFYICFPDHGACERYANYRDVFEEDYYEERTIIMNKVRDLNNKGKIMSINIVSEPECVLHDSVIIIRDDLCDAGGTFCWAAKILREKYPTCKLAIKVSHLVNEVGLKNLSENFDEVYITNSYKDWDVSQYPNVHVKKLF